MYMDVVFSELKQKEVINVADGKHLGKVCDITFSFPEGKVAGFTVTGCKGFRLSKPELFLPLRCVNKIGEDAVLVNFGENPPPPPAGQKPACPPLPCPPPCPPPPPRSRRSFEEYE